MALEESLMIIDIELSDFKNDANLKIIRTFIIIGIVSNCLPPGMERA